MKFIRNLLRFVKLEQKSGPNQKDNGLDRFSFINIGFHGDRYLLAAVDVLAQAIEVFIETGTNVGSSLAYFAGKYPHIECLSCEPDTEAFLQAEHNTLTLNNVSLYNQTSQIFLTTLANRRPDIFHKNVLFWLDAHGYGFQWPLKEELDFITSHFSQAFILIDDFKVPAMDFFAYDIYENQVCAYDYVKDALSPAHSYNIYYPNYSEQTSSHHPLCGWGLITFGAAKDIQFPPWLTESIRQE